MPRIGLIINNLYTDLSDDDLASFIFKTATNIRGDVLAGSKASKPQVRQLRLMHREQRKRQRVAARELRREGRNLSWADD